MVCCQLDSNRRFPDRQPTSFSLGRKENEAKETLFISVARFRRIVGDDGGRENLTSYLPLWQQKATSPNEQKTARMGYPGMVGGAMESSVLNDLLDRSNHNKNTAASILSV